MNDQSRLEQILAAAAKGRTDKEIAGQLGIAHSTVETHWKRIRAKYGVTSRSAAVAAWITERAQGSKGDLERAIAGMSAYIGQLHEEQASSSTARSLPRNIELGWAATGSLVYVYHLKDMVHFHYMSDSCRQFGWEPSDWKEGRVVITSLIHPEDLFVIFAAREQSVAQGKRSQAYFYRVNTPRFGYRWFYDRQVFTAPSVLDDGLVIGHAMDMTPLIEKGLVKQQPSFWALDIPDAPDFG